MQFVHRTMKELTKLLISAKWCVKLYQILKLINVELGFLVVHEKGKLLLAAQKLCRPNTFFSSLFEVKNF